MSPIDKPLFWLRGEVRTTPSRLTSSVGARCHKPRTTNADKAWRIFHRIDEDAIILLDVFSKRHGERLSASSLIVEGGCACMTPRRAESESRRVHQHLQRAYGTGASSMRTAKRKQLEAAGWTVCAAADFLELTPEDAALMELKLSLGARLGERRAKQNLSQTDLARRLGSSRSRVAKMEAGDPSVSLDLLVRGLLATGATQRDVARAVAA